MLRVSVSSKTSSFAPGGSPIHSTECTNHGFGGFSMYCMNRLFPGHEKEPVLVRVFERNETPAPTFVHRHVNVSSSVNKLVVILIDVFDADKEVNAAPAPKHRFQMLGQRDFQSARSKLSHRRFRFDVDRLDLHPQHAAIERE